jgi:hypothetical protein
MAHRPNKLRDKELPTYERNNTRLDELATIIKRSTSHLWAQTFQKLSSARTTPIERCPPGIRASMQGLRLDQRDYHPPGGAESLVLWFEPRGLPWRP